MSNKVERLEADMRDIGNQMKGWLNMKQGCLDLVIWDLCFRMDVYMVGLVGFLSIKCI